MIDGVGINYITKLMKNNPAAAEGGKMNCYANMIRGKLSLGYA
jgi:hypothetical protein